MFIVRTRHIALTSFVSIFYGAVVDAILREATESAVHSVLGISLGHMSMPNDL